MMYKSFKLTIMWFHCVTWVEFTCPIPIHEFNPGFNHYCGLVAEGTQYIYKRKYGVNFAFFKTKEHDGKSRQ